MTKESQLLQKTNKQTNKKQKKPMKPGTEVSSWEHMSLFIPSVNSPTYYDPFL